MTGGTATPSKVGRGGTAKGAAAESAAALTQAVQTCESASASPWPSSWPAAATGETPAPT